MKKLCLILSFALCFSLLVSCYTENSDEESSIPIQDGQESISDTLFEGGLAAEELKTVSVGSSFLQNEKTTSLCVNDNGDIKLFLIDTYQKFETVSELFEEADAVSENFFEESSLMIVSLYASSSAYWYEFGSAVAESSKVCFRFERVNSADDEVVLPMSMESYLVFSLKKSETVGYEKYESIITDVDSSPVSTLTAGVIDELSLVSLSFSQFTQSENSHSLLVSEGDGAKIYVIDTYEKFTTVSDLLDNTDSIAKEFFDDKLLMVTAFITPSSGYTYKFLDASASQKTVHMRFAIESKYGMVDTAPFEHLMVIAFDKSEVAGCDQYATEEISLFYVFDVNLLNHPDPEEPPVACLSVEDTLALKAFFDGLEWSKYDSEDVSGDYSICNDIYYCYNSENRTLIDLDNRKTVTLSDEEKTILDKYLE